MYKLFIIPLLVISLNANEKITYSNMGNNCKIDFTDLISDGLSFHPSIGMSRESIKSANYEVDSAKWGYYPTPSIDFSAKSGSKKRTLVRLDQPIWAGGRISSEIDKAEAYKEQTEYELTESSYKLIDDYSNSLKEYIKTREKMKVLNQNKKNFYDLSQMLDRFMKAGELSQADKNLLNSKMANLSSDLIITKSKYKVSLIQLELLTGKKIDCEIAFEPKNKLPTKLNIDRLVYELKETHPALKAIDAKIKKAMAEVDNAKSKLWPNLVLRAEHTRGTIYDETKPETENLVYFSLNMATGPGLSALSNIDKAKIDVSKIKFEKNTKVKELADKLMNDYTNYVTVVNHLKVIENDIKGLELIYESNRRLFISSKKTWLDVVNSLSELNKQKINYVEALVEKKILAYKIALNTGKIDLNTLKVKSDL